MRDESSDPKKADSYMQDVVATIFDSEGAPTLKLVTPKMIHYPEKNMTHIITPRVTIYRNSPEPWYIDADYANATNGINEILFWSHVDIHHSADSENPKTSLITDSLSVYPNKQLANTDQPVVFHQPDTTVYATGMQANLNNSTIKLLSKTRGEYVPTS